MLNFLFCLHDGGGVEIGLDARTIRRGSYEENVVTSDDVSEALTELTTKDGGDLLEASNSFLVPGCHQLREGVIVPP